MRGMLEDESNEKRKAM